ncbi:MAG: amidohydrolase family protein [Dehalococcoidia bacterium]
MVTSQPVRPLAISGGVLIDGNGGAPLPNATVVIEDGRFSRVGPAAATPVPDGAEALDARGAYVIPGLVDMHVHTYTPDRQHTPLFIAAGVTTAMNLGDQVEHILPLRAAIESGAVLGPRLFCTGPILEQGEVFEGFAHISRRIDAARVEAEVDALADAGMDAIKLYVTITPDTARRAVARAHGRGLPVFMHQQATWGADAADAGVDCLEHIFPFAEFTPDDPRPDATQMNPFQFGGWMWRWLPDIDPRSEQIQRFYEHPCCAPARPLRPNAGDLRLAAGRCSGRTWATRR